MVSKLTLHLVVWRMKVPIYKIQKNRISIKVFTTCKNHWIAMGMAWNFSKIIIGEDHWWQFVEINSANKKYKIKKKNLKRLSLQKF